MKRTGILFSALLLVSSLMAQESKPLLTINDTVKIGGEEFLRVYNKNNSPELLAERKSMDEYLDLFINYKLKVLEAKRLQLDTVSKFKKELDGYIKQLAAPYLIDQAVDERLLQEAYERGKTEIRSSHVLVKLDQDALPADTLTAYNKAIAIRKRLMKEDFAKVAKEVSEDPSAKENAGDIGFTTVFGTIYPYETALYTLKQGDLSMPVRTKFGYHIIKVTEKRPFAGEVKVAHIMINAVDGDTAKMKSAKETIDSVYLKLKNGAKWNDMVQAYSEDARSKTMNGEMNWFDKTSRLPQSFADTAFSLKNKDDYSHPVRTPYGWHIVKLIDKRGVRPFDEQKEELKKSVSRDVSRNRMSREIVLERLKKEFKLTINQKTVDAFASKLDSTILDGKWKMPSDKDFSGVLAVLNGKPIEEITYAKWLLEKQKIQGNEPLSSYNYKKFKSFINETVINLEMTKLPQKSVDYRNLSQEYHDGMLLFDLTDRMVWSKAHKDSTGLQKTYEQNKAKYLWGERLYAALYTCKDSATKVALKKLLSQRIAKKYTDDYIVKTLNKKDSMAVKLEMKKYNRGENKHIDSLKWEKNAVYDMPKSVVFEVRDVTTGEQKKLEECRGLVATDYQKTLEEEWLKQLRATYRFSVDQAVFAELKNKK